MHIFIAGGTGAIGRQLVPMLVEAGHHVTAITRSEAKLGPLHAAGAESIVCDVFDAERLRQTVADARPEIVIHQLTDLPPTLDPDPARFEEQFAGNLRIRTEGTRNLVEAAAAAGVGRIVAQSIAFVYAPVGGAVKGEDDPLFDDAPESERRGGAGAGVGGDRPRGDRGSRAAVRVLLRPGDVLRVRRFDRGSRSTRRAPDRGG